MSNILTAELVHRSQSNNSFVGHDWNGALDGSDVICAATSPHAPRRLAQVSVGKTVGKSNGTIPAYPPFSVGSGKAANVKGNFHEVALHTAIGITLPLGVAASDRNATVKRILAPDTDLPLLARDLLAVEAVIDTAITLCRNGTLAIFDTAIGFPNQGIEIIFTVDEYIAFAKRALADAVHRAKTESIGPEFSLLGSKALNRLAPWERSLVESAHPLAELQNPLIRAKVAESKLVFGFDASKSLKGALFFGKCYFRDAVAKKTPLPVTESIAFIFHSELEGDAKLAAAVLVLKGSCDLV